MKIEIGANDFCKPDCKYLDVDVTSVCGGGDVIRHMCCRHEEICANAVRSYRKDENTALKDLSIELDFTKANLSDVRDYNETLEHRLKHLLQSRYIRSFDEVERHTGKHKKNILDADSLTHFLKWICRVREK